MLLLSVVVVIVAVVVVVVVIAVGQIIDGTVVVAVIAVAVFVVVTVSFDQFSALSVFSCCGFCCHLQCSMAIDQQKNGEK